MHTLLILLVILLPSHALSQEDMPVEITAKILRYFPEKKIAIFERSVEASQGEMKIHSDKMEIDLKSDDLPQDDLKGSKIESIKVDGNVVIIAGKDKARADRGEYLVEKNMIYLYGNVKLEQGRNIILGDQLEYNKKTGESLVTSKSTRVRGSFLPNEKISSK